MVDRPSTRNLTWIDQLGRFCRVVGELLLILYGIFFIRLMVGNFGAVVDRETLALRRMERAFEQGAVPVGPSGPSVPLDPGGGSGVPGVSSFVDLPDWALILISIIGGIYLAYNLILDIPITISEWQEVFQCEWLRSFWSFLGCLLKSFWVLVHTIFWIILAIGVLILVIVNILAIIAIFV